MNRPRKPWTWWRDEIVVPVAIWVVFLVAIGLMGAMAGPS